MNSHSPTIIDYFKVALAWRKKILFNIILITLITVGISLIIPKTYTANSVLLPPKTPGGNSFQNESANIPFFSFSGLFDNIMNESMRFISILQSRTVKENAIKKFDLISFFNAETIEEALEDLEDATEFELKDEGTIWVSMSVSTGWFHSEMEELIAKDLSADIVNYFVTELDELNKKLNIEQATFHREFIEKRYLDNIDELHNAENNLNKFQHKFGLISLEEQTSDIIESTAVLKNQILYDELQLQILLKTLNSEDGKIEQLKRKIHEFRLKLNDLEHGTPLKQDVDQLFPSLSQLPDLSLEYLRLQRELDIQTELFKYSLSNMKKPKLKKQEMSLQYRF